jgi:hypothetical protein
LLRCMSLFMAHLGHDATSDLSPLSDQKRTLGSDFQLAAKPPHYAG